MRIMRRASVQHQGAAGQLASGWNGLRRLLGRAIEHLSFMPRVRRVLTRQAITSDNRSYRTQTLKTICASDRLDIHADTCRIRMLGFIRPSELIRRSTRGLDQLGPLRHFAANESGEFISCHGHGLDPGSGQSRSPFRRPGYLSHHIINRHNDRLRRVLRCPYGKPERRVESRQPRFRQCPLRAAMAPPRRDRQRPAPPRSPRMRTGAGAASLPCHGFRSFEKSGNI